jgi:hypothetical protein
VTQRNAQIEGQFRALGPWVTKFMIDGVSYGGSYYTMRDGRITQFREAFPDAETVLELGSLEGGHTLALSRLAGVKRVVAIEAREPNIERARLIQRLLSLNNVEFVQGDLETYELRGLGRFDAVFCVGLLYHLTAPWALLERVAKASHGLFLWTHYVSDDRANLVANGYRGTSHPEGGPNDPLSGLSPAAFRPTLSSLQQMLADHGFPNIDIIQTEPSHQNGPAVTIVARGI